MTELNKNRIEVLHTNRDTHCTRTFHNYKITERNTDYMTERNTDYRMTERNTDYRMSELIITRAKHYDLTTISLEL